MGSVIVVGAQWGDEGKGKVVDLLAQDADMIVRYNGGNNAGGTLEFTLNGRKTHLVTHTLPRCVGSPSAKGHIGSGCVVNPSALLEEIIAAESLGISLEDRLTISGRATLIQPSHILLDRETGKEVGTTGKGIGPAYADQAYRNLGIQRKNIRFADFLADPQACMSYVASNLEQVMAAFNVKDIDAVQLLHEFEAAAKSLSKFYNPDPLFVQKYAESGAKILMDGANAIGLDCITGAVPYVTSSRTIPAAAYTGGDFSSKFHEKTIGVIKAIASRVGNGPFIGEYGGALSEDYCGEEGGYKYIKDVEKKLYDVEEYLGSQNLFELGIALRVLGGEYGATTGRPRRMGMLDLVRLRQDCRINGIDELHINKVDCLNQFSHTSLPGIPFITGYQLGGETIDYVPDTAHDQYHVKEVAEFTPAFTQDISHVREAKDLPEEVHKFVRVIGDFVGVPVGSIGVGPAREQYISLR